MRCYVAETKVSPLKIIQRDRMLPAPGEILVERGERVDPVQVIGRAQVPGQFHIINVAQELGVTVRTADRYVKVKPGQAVQAGQVVASKGMLLGRSCRSPFDGHVTGTGGGRLLIEAEAEEVEVRAGYYGVVSDVYPKQGVGIEVSGALIEGAWGNGHEGFGVLQVTVKSPDKPLRSRAVDTSSRGVILVGGARLDMPALERAVELQARGIIVGGLVPELIDEVKKLSFPVVATEGIGTIPMSNQIFELLSTHDNREAILDGRFSSGWGARRPEIIIPLGAAPDTIQEPFHEDPLQVGDRVRAVRMPHTGLTGKVVEIPANMHRVATGSRLLVARVKPDSGDESVLVPIANLEFLA
ncbi:MAG: hypothetical protein JW900_00680 [Anaerolineae bacterium]|nr:hypothetical protein [Anaerolineae bacterium]